MNFSEAVTSITRTMIVPKVYDTVTRGSAGLMTFLQTAKDWRTGTAYEVPLKFQSSTNGGVIGIADQLDTSRQNVRTRMSFQPKAITKPVVIADIELVLNKGDEQIVDIFETEFDSQAQDMLNDLAQQLYTGNGSGNTWDSLANAADDGTNYGSYGGLSRTTYPSIKAYFLASTGALTLAKMATAMDSSSTGTDNPDIIFTTKTLWSAYEALLTPTVHAQYQTSGFPKMNAFGGVANTPGMGGNQGFTYVNFRGTALTKDEQVTSGNMFFVNTKAFGFKGINMTTEGFEQLNFKKTSDAVPSGVPGNVPSTRGFNFRVLMSPVDQFAKIGHLTYFGNFIAENPRLLGHMTGVTA